MQTSNIYQPRFQPGQSILEGYNPFKEPIEIRGNQVFGTRYGMYLGTVDSPPATRLGFPGKVNFISSFMENASPAFTKKDADLQERREKLLQDLFQSATKTNPTAKAEFLAQEKAKKQVEQKRIEQLRASPNFDLPSGSITQKGNNLFRDGVFLGTADASANPMSAVQTSANPMSAVQQSLMGSGATNPSYSSPLFG